MRTQGIRSIAGAGGHLRPRQRGGGRRGGLGATEGSGREDRQPLEASLEGQMSRWPGVPRGVHVLQPSPLPRASAGAQLRRQMPESAVSRFKRLKSGCRSLPRSAVGGTGLGHPQPGCHPSPALHP